MKAKFLIALVAFVAMLAAFSTHAKTPDGETPSVETICDAFKDTKGPAFGLCNAYCEAMDCGDPNQHAANRACQRVADNFFKTTGLTLPGGYNYDANGNLIHNNCERQVSF